MAMPVGMLSTVTLQDASLIFGTCRPTLHLYPKEPIVDYKGPIGALWTKI